jgi:hypothetical protein
MAAPIRNVFACLVHESRECVVDLVRNLRFQDPESTVLLYDGSRQGQIAGQFPVEQYGAMVHPNPHPMAWGRLHEFALDCMRFALGHIPFDTLTIVDSDQLAARAGYSQHLAQFLEGRRGIGMLGNSPGVLSPGCGVGPVQAAFQEFELWRPFLRRFQSGEAKFAHWSFWPSTVFTADAARALTDFFANDRQLHEIMARSRIWATEEVVLPTLTALLGFEIAPNPCSYDFVKYRTPYSVQQIDSALDRGDVFWIHPVPRGYDDPLRRRIREQAGQYEQPAPEPPTGAAPAAGASNAGFGLVLTLPILQRMRPISGWLDDEEADLLIATAVQAVTTLPAEASIVEIGSFCGRSTVVLGSAVAALKAQTRVYAIDPHDGRVGALDRGIQVVQPTLDTFQRNIFAAGLNAIVEPIVQRSTDVAWSRPIGLLFIDGLHDYASVADDFHHFQQWLALGGYIAFHDYADYYPGVRKFVDELVSGGQFRRVQCARSMIVLRNETAVQEMAADVRAAAPAIVSAEPLVSCVMPTADRRALVPQAIRHFLRQDYQRRELIVADDGADSIEDLVPRDSRIRYYRVAETRKSIGAKHNLACGLAEGDVIVHWDDDDWNASWRLSYQVGQLLEQSEDALCGLARLFFYEPRSRRAWEYVYPGAGPPWVAGATFCYRKTFWERRPFPDMNEGGDTVFVWSLRDARVVPLQDNRFYVATVHAANTSPRKTNHAAWVGRPAEDIRQLMDAEDWSFFEKWGAAR